MASPSAPAPSSLAVSGRTGLTSRRTSALPPEGSKADKPSQSGAAHQGEPREKEKAGELRSHVDFRALRMKAQEATKITMPLRKGAMAQSLRDTIAKMRSEVGTLMSQHDRRKWKQDASEAERLQTKLMNASRGMKKPLGRMPEGAGRRKCAGAPPDTDQSLVKLRQLHAHQHRSSLLRDESESSDSDEQEEAEETGSPQGEEELDGEVTDSEADDYEALGRDAVAASIAADQAAEEQWDMESARDHVQALMSGLHVEERVNVLEDLKGYFQDKLDVIEDDSKKINDFEQEASDEMTNLAQAANNLQTSIDDREYLAYQCLWRYYTTLQRQIQAIPQIDKMSRLHNVRDELLEFARHRANKKLLETNNDKSITELLDIPKMLPENVTSAEVLGAVASVQDDISLLKESIELDLRRKASYEHTLDLLIKDGLSKISGDEIATQVIQDVRQWVQDRSKTETGSHRLQQQVQNRGAELDKLSEECETLRKRVEGQEREAEMHLDSDKHRKSDQQQPFNPCQPREVSTLWLHADRTQSAATQYNLFTEEASETFKKEFRELHDENVKIEEQLAQFQELESLAKTAVQVLQDNTERFVEAAAQARRNLQVGSLPDEDEEDDDSKLLKELKGMDESLIRKQDEDHKAEMAKLEERVRQMRSDISDVEEERQRLEASIEKERKRQESTLTEILNVEAKHKEAQAQLDKLPQLTLDEDEQNLERLTTENARLAMEVETARRNLTMAMRRKELNGQALEQSRDLAAKILFEAKNDVNKTVEERKAEEAEAERLKEETKVQEDAWKKLNEEVQQTIERSPSRAGAIKSEEKDGDKKEHGEQKEPPAEAPGNRKSSLGALLALKKSANLWKGKARIHSPKVSEEVRKYLDEEQRDTEEAAKLQAKTLRLHKQIAAIEAWAKQAKAGMMLPDLPQEEVPAEVTRLRKQVKSKKKELQGMRAHWWNVRELAKRGARIPTGKEAIEIRNAIVNICDEALAQVGRDANTGSESQQPNPRAENGEGGERPEGAQGDDDGSKTDGPAVEAKVESEPASDPTNGEEQDPAPVTSLLDALL